MKTLMSLRRTVVTVSLTSDCSQTANLNFHTVMTLVMPRAGTHIEVAFVAVGAMLVGSCNETVKEGDRVVRGDELGYFGELSKTHLEV